MTISDPIDIKFNTCTLKGADTYPAKKAATQPDRAYRLQPFYSIEVLTDQKRKHTNLLFKGKYLQIRKT